MQGRPSQGAVRYFKLLHYNPKGLCCPPTTSSTTVIHRLTSHGQQISLTNQILLTNNNCLTVLAAVALVDALSAAAQLLLTCLDPLVNTDYLQLSFECQADLRVSNNFLSNW